MHEEVERRTPVHVLGGCVGDEVGAEVTHAGSEYLQDSPAKSFGAGVASRFCSKTTRLWFTVGFASDPPMSLRMVVSNVISRSFLFVCAVALPSPQPPTASRKQSAKCCLFGLVKVGSSVVSPQQSHTRR